MASAVVLVSRFSLTLPLVNTPLETLEDGDSVRYLSSLDGQELLQLRGYDNLGQFATSSEQLLLDMRRFAPYVTGDVRRELLTLVEAPKPIKSKLPETDYLQLRHIEVPPAKYEAYRAWRERTIFEVVRESAEIHTFLAYHSLVSGQPGVMFFSGFSGDLEKYRAVFDSERYREIVRQAGDSYIAGGTDGLFTRLYVRPTLLGSRS
jgi:hypothetical protein